MEILLHLTARFVNEVGGRRRREMSSLSSAKEAQRMKKCDKISACNDLRLWIPFDCTWVAAVGCEGVEKLDFYSRKHYHFKVFVFYNLVDLGFIVSFSILFQKYIFYQF